MTEYTGFEIAVIGISGRFPGAENVDLFWNNLKNGIESIRNLSEEELLNEGEDKGILSNQSYVRANSFIEEKEYFDSHFFNYTPDEAKLMDPQMRILHECVWHALEDAGYDVLNYKNRIGLFTGATTNLNWLNYSRIENLKNLVDDFSLMHLSDVNFNNTHISYLLNLRGPSISVNTACSTSLVAIHQACNSLILGECGIAVAGGISIKNYSKKGYLYVEGMINSSTGQCRAFDEGASGTISGEGVGVVVLKRLKKALEDNDNIYAVIKGTGINNDGREKVGYTAPSGKGQTEALIMARKMAKVPVESITYVEAHGTATKLGDPIEVEGLSRAFGKSEKKYCALGSVKTNIGHLDAAAGVAGFIKVVLSLKNKQIPPSLHFKTLNDKIDLKDTPFYVNTELKEWKNERYPLRAGVSSFGIGGTNAHIILEEAPYQKPTSDSRSCQLLVLSAKTKTALERNVENLIRYLNGTERFKFPDVIYTLQVGRRPLEYRTMVACSNVEEAIVSLSSNKLFSVSKAKSQVVFMFPGQGSQYFNMCRGLYCNEELFRTEVDMCLEIVKDISGKDLKRVIFSDSLEEVAGDINNTEYTQPALFIIEYCLAKTLMKWGIVPDSMIGHSIGEYVAACVSGVFSLEDALSLVLKRGELMQCTDKGKMLSIIIPEETLNSILKDHKGLSLAAVNSAEHCVVSGSEQAIESFQWLMEKSGYQNKIIRTSHAFHSNMMNGILDAYKKEVQRVKINQPQIPFISNLSGKIATYPEISDADYWVRHLRQTVRFAQGIDTLLKKETIFIESGPGRVLSTFVLSNEKVSKNYQVINTVRGANETTNDVHQLISALGKLWLNGIEPDWEQFYAKEIRRRVSLPLYSFDKIKYPVHVDSFKMISDRISSAKSIKSKDVADWFYVPTWKLASAIPDDSEVKTDEITLLFADSVGVADALIAKFRLKKKKVIVVRIEKNFVKESSTAYRLNPETEKDFLELYKNISKDEMLPHRIIHGWAITRPDNDSFEKEFSTCCHLFYYSLVNVIKAAQTYGGILGRQVTVLSNGLHNIIDNEPIHPVKGLALGLLKVLPQEFPSVVCKHVDIHSLDKGSDELYTELYREIMCDRPGKVISFRNSRRWEQTFDKTIFRTKSNANNFKEKGVYLITGGLGDLGFNLALNLLSSYDARVILMGRTTLASGENGDAMQPADEMDEGKKGLVRKLQTLRENGRNVLYVSCNIANPIELADAVALSEKEYGAIDGIIHAAGLKSGKSINSFTNLRMEDHIAQFESKVFGINSLGTVFKNKRLDFCIVVSSLSSFLGGIGFAAYASANAYMDYYIKSFQNKGELTNWISINLDGLNFGKSESKIIDAREIFTVVAKTLSWMQFPQLIISATDLFKRLDDWININANPEGDIMYEDTKNDAGSLNLPQQGLSAVEGILIAMWSNFFGKTELNVDDNFFEIGGDSLKALTMIGRIYKQFNFEISVMDFFENSSIKYLSSYIESHRNAGGKRNSNRSIAKVEKRQFYRASSAQERMLFEQMANEGNLLNNISRAFIVEGELNVERIQNSFQLLINRHECLRTYLMVEGDHIVQCIAENVEFHVTVLDDNKYETAKEALDDFVHPFDVTNTPLIRCGLWHRRKEDTLLFVDTHHIVCDGVSLNILMNEFTMVYSGHSLEPLNCRYIDYAHWQKSRSKNLGLQREFWSRQLAGELPKINLPTMEDRDIVNIYLGNKKTFKLDIEKSKEIRRIAADANVTEFMFMLSLYYILLFKISGDNDIIIGTDAVGRTQDDFKNVVGTFINVIPLRLYVADELLFKQLLEQVKKCVLVGLENQDFQYEEMSSLLKSDKRIVDIYFSYTNFFDRDSNLREMGFRPIGIEKPVITTRYELELNISENNEELEITLLYSTQLYSQKTIELFMSYFLRILFDILKDCNLTLGRIQLELSELVKSSEGLSANYSTIN